MARTLETLLDWASYPLETHAGRDIGAGHLRGWGLEYADLYQRVLSEPLFCVAAQAAQARGTVVAPHKLANLYLILRYAIPADSGDIFEFGSFRGGSAVFMGTVLKHLDRKTKVFAFDTFEGMPETDPTRDLHGPGDFADTGYEGLLDYIRENGLEPYVETVRGKFSDTLSGVLARGGKVALTHVDCDIYEPIRYVIRASLDAMTPGSHIVFDDPLHGSCLGAFDAVQELMIRKLNLTAEQVYPHLVFRYPPIGRLDEAARWRRLARRVRARIRDMRLAQAAS